MLFAFDIETGPTEIEKVKAIKPFSPGRLKDPEKVAAAEQEHYGKAALSPTTGEVLVIGYAADEKRVLLETRYDFTEQQLLRRFWTFVEKECFRRKNDLCGWSILQFDLPFLITRSRILGIDYPAKVMTGRNWHHLFRDLERIWSCWTYGRYTKFDEELSACIP